MSVAQEMLEQVGRMATDGRWAQVLAGGCYRVHRVMASRELAKKAGELLSQAMPGVTWGIPVRTHIDVTGSRLSLEVRSR